MAVEGDTSLMAIPMALTTVSVSRPDQSSDGYSPTKTAPTVIASGVRAAITSPTGATVLTGGVRTEYGFVLNCDPVDLQAGDLVTDDATGIVYVVEWAQPRTGLGLDHVNAQLRIVAGAF